MDVVETTIRVHAIADAHEDARLLLQHEGEILAARAHRELAHLLGSPTSATAAASATGTLAGSLTVGGHSGS
jgi:hypothetical protein